MLAKWFVDSGCGGITGSSVGSAAIVSDDGGIAFSLPVSLEFSALQAAKNSANTKAATSKHRFFTFYLSPFLCRLTGSSYCDILILLLKADFKSIGKVKMRV